MNNEIKKLELKIQSLKERFAKKMADYEDEIAEIRADATMMFEHLNQQLERQQGDKVVDVQTEK